MKKTILLTETLSTNKKSILKNNDRITLYVCGITPYDYAHIGHGRCYVVFDVLVRTMRYFDYEITYCRNITDLDDKLINKAKLLYNNPLKFIDIANEFYKHFLNDLNNLNCIRPDYEPKVTNSIQEIIVFIEKLIKDGYAYTINNDVYFEIEKYKDYGDLSKRNLDEQISGARISINNDKKNPLDFVLWKGSEEEPYWESPWGKGRPGWHIECSVMSNNAFGKTIDIHGGGMDLIFPHHENEKAQSECHNKTKFVNIWMHCAFININKQKMSKSLGNSIFLKDLIEKYGAMEFRYYILSHSYISPIDFCFENIESFAKSYKTLKNLFAETNFDISFKYEHKLIDEINNHLCDDLNTAAVFGLIFKNIELIKKDENLKKMLKKILSFSLGFNFNENDDKKANKNYSEEILDLINKRNEARKYKDFNEADRIRDILIEKGIEINDNKL
jgi:cysteinyl-tRNA synthetase